MGHTLNETVTVHFQLSLFFLLQLARLRRYFSRNELFIQFFLDRKTSKLKLSHVDFPLHHIGIEIGNVYNIGIEIGNVTSYMHGH